MLLTYAAAADASPALLMAFADVIAAILMLAVRYAMPITPLCLIDFAATRTANNGAATMPRCYAAAACYLRYASSLAAMPRH